MTDKPDTIQSFDQATWASTVDAWATQIIATGGITLPTGSQAAVTAKADALDQVVAANGTVLPDTYAQKLSSLVTAAEAVPTGDVAFDHNGTLADRADAVAAHLDGMLSQAVAIPLATLVTTLDSAYLDGTISTPEQTGIVTAASALDAVLASDSIKLSDQALATASTTATDLHTLANAGFLALDTDQLAAVAAFDSVYDSYQAGNATISDVHAALGDVKDTVGDQLVLLTGVTGFDHGGSDWGM